MCPLREEEDRNQKNSIKNNLSGDMCNDATQKIDSQFYPGDGVDNFLCGANALPSHDSFLLENEFETQLVNLAGETQVIDFDCETQVLDTLDCLGSWKADCNAGVAPVSDSEGTSITEVLCDTQEVSQHDSPDHSQKLAANVSGALSDTYKNEEHHSGDVCKGFTSIRAAAFRAAGLAARTRRANCNSSSTRSDQSSLDQIFFDQVDSSLFGNLSDEKHIFNKHFEEVEISKNTNSCRVGTTTTRKLLMEDVVAEVGHSVASMNHPDDSLINPELIASENCLAGLSYVNSEQPGELSQANALEVVDRFLEQNLMEFDKGISVRVHTAEKAKIESVAKGSRVLAKSFNLQRRVGVSGIYEWDDTREDEGGGDFFLKKKELFFDYGDTKKTSLTEPRKRNCSDLKNFTLVGDDGDEELKNCCKRKLKDSVNSHPGLVRAKRKSLNFGDKAIPKNLAKNLDGLINLASENRLADNEASKDIPVVENIGPDTQIAAEAMYNLCYEVHLADDNIRTLETGVGNTTRGIKKNQSSYKASHGEQKLIRNRRRPTGVGVVTRRAKQAMSARVGTSKKSPLSSVEQLLSTRDGLDSELGKKGHKMLADSNNDAFVLEKKYSSTPPSIRKRGRAGLRSNIHENDPLYGTESGVPRSEKGKRTFMQEQLGFYVPVAHRTRKSIENNSPKDAETSIDASVKINDPINAPDPRKKKKTAIDKNIQIITIEELKKFKSTRWKQSNVKDYGASGLDELKHIKGKRTLQENLLGKEPCRHVNPRLTRSRTNAASISPDSGRNHADYFSMRNTSALSCIDQKTKLQIALENQRSGKESAHHDSYHLNVKSISSDATAAIATKQNNKKSKAKTSKSSECTETNRRLEASPRERVGTSSTCTPPASCATPVNNASPLCMGDEYHKQSCRKNLTRLSLVREINNLVSGSPGSPDGMKEVRKRREITSIRVLFSQHLDVDVIKQQKKILGRLGAAVTSSMLDATHFVADEFIRTRNMLEAIALGKPVVTHLWLESCGQASFAIDEKNYILRDVRKEKECGFSMPVSLSRACQYPLLQGQRVLITPNTKPGKDILASLVKAVHGVALERLGRSVLNDEKLPDDLLILSCEEDYDVCVPFLEKGGAVYSSELLLNGIVKQKLEYERHRLFEDHVKRTRSTIRVKKKHENTKFT